VPLSPALKYPKITLIFFIFSDFSTANNISSRRIIFSDYVN
jgi:hypothetical protein